MNRGLSLSINQFPLTPALSLGVLGGREQQGTTGEIPELVGFAGREQRFMVPVGFADQLTIILPFHEPRGAKRASSPQPSPPEEERERGW